VFAQELVGRGRVERDLAAEALVGYDAEGVLVGGAGDLGPAALLGRHVIRRPEEVSRGAGRGLLDLLGDAEVCDGHPPARVQHDVARLDVAVDDAVLVGVPERVGDLVEDGDGLLELESPALLEERVEALAFE